MILIINALINNSFINKEEFGRRKKWLYGLLFIPLMSAILALNHYGFFFKAGVAGAGILIICGLYYPQLKEYKDVWAILGALLFSMAGDWFLSNRHGDVSMFISGIGLFFIAHLGYLAFALLNGRLNKFGTLLILVVYLSFFILELYPVVGNKALSIAALLYLLISCFSLGAAIGIADNSWFKWLYVFGIVMILFSDTIIAFREFVKYKELDFLILPTYYLAQISVTASLIVRRLSKFQLT